MLAAAAVVTVAFGWLILDVFRADDPPWILWLFATLYAALIGVMWLMVFQFRRSDGWLARKMQGIVNDPRHVERSVLHSAVMATVLAAVSVLLVVAGSFSPWWVAVFAVWAIANWSYFGYLRRRAG